MTEKVGAKKSISRKILDKLMQFHLPIILVLAIVIGIAFPAPGNSPTSSLSPRSLLIRYHLHEVLCVYDLHHLWSKTRYQFSERSYEVLGCKPSVVG